MNLSIKNNTLACRHSRRVYIRSLQVLGLSLEEVTVTKLLWRELSPGRQGRLINSSYSKPQEALTALAMIPPFFYYRAFPTKSVCIFLPPGTCRDRQFRGIKIKPEDSR